jgi:hypothetical protein
MDSASPIANSVAGQSTTRSSTTFTFAMEALNKAENFVLDWLGIRPAPGYRGAHHPSATGYRQHP